jgi:hypothetical protein
MVIAGHVSSKHLLNLLIKNQRDEESTADATQAMISQKQSVITRYALIYKLSLIRLNGACEFVTQNAYFN